MLVAVAQFAATTDKRHNSDEARRLIAEAASRGAKLVVLPENSMYTNPDPTASTAHESESITGTFASQISLAAKTSSIAVVVGMTESPSAPEGKPTNTVLVIDRNGEPVGLYRKTHLYDAFGRRESDRIQAQYPKALTFDLDGVTFGVMTCYDLRFPEMARFLVDAGANAVIVPAAWAVGPSKENHWITLCRARAIENTSYVIASGQTGPNNAGHSSIVDPMGNVIAAAGEAPGVAIANVSITRIDSVRATNPSLTNRKFQVVPS